MSIQRYGLFSDGDMWPVKDGFGKWVKHDDHKAALAEKEAELEKARELLKATLEMVSQVDDLNELYVMNYDGKLCNHLDMTNYIEAYLGGKT